MRPIIYTGMVLVAALVMGCGTPSNSNSVGGRTEATSQTPSNPTESQQPETEAGIKLEKPGTAASDVAEEEQATRLERPEKVDLQVMVEQIEMTMPFVLVSAPSLPFSTYIFEEFQTEVLTEPSSGVRATHSRKDLLMNIEVTLYPQTATQAEVLASFHELVHSKGGSVEEHIPQRDWAVDTAQVDFGDVAEVHFLVEHKGQHALMIWKFHWQLADAFAPVVQGFVGQWQWNDGTYLDPGSNTP